MKEHSCFKIIIRWLYLLNEVEKIQRTKGEVPFRLTMRVANLSGIIDGFKDARPADMRVVQRKRIHSIPRTAVA